MKRVWGNITKYYVLKLKRKDFNSLIRHSVKKLGNEDLDEISECLGEEWRTRIQNALSSGLAYGAYEDEKLVSVATVPARRIYEKLGFKRTKHVLFGLRP